jgi:hypothetical protein
MDTFAGLPAHPLLVHAPVVLVPVVALLVILMIVRPQWLERFGWLAVGLAGLALVTGVLAENSGEALEEAVEDSASRTLLHAHEEAGETSLAGDDLEAQRLVGALEDRQHAGVDEVAGSRRTPRRSPCRRGSAWPRG